VTSRFGKGFSLVELIAVMVIVSVISVAAISRLMPTSLIQLQAARDQVVSALLQAQQKALYAPYDIRLTTLAGSVDVRQDVNRDGVFAADESIRAGSVTYPLILVAGVQVSTQTLNYSGMGETAAVSLTVSKGSRSLVINVSASGFVE
jgi:MSHA pilin protein MshC